MTTESILTRILEELEEFIKEHRGHAILSGSEGSANRWRARCKDCGEDFIVDFNTDFEEELSAEDIIDIEIELDSAVDRLAEKYNCKTECLGWL